VFGLPQRVPNASVGDPCAAPDMWERGNEQATKCCLTGAQGLELLRDC